MSKLTAPLSLLIVFIITTLLQSAYTLDLASLDTPVKEYNGFEYQFIPDSVDWQLAEKACQIWGGSLGSVLTVEENNFLRNLIESSGGGANDTVWLGYSDREVSGQWLWTDSSVSSFNLFSDSSPIITSGCAASANIDQWVPLSCAQKNGFICKRQQGECSWTNTVFGAPIPLVTSEYEDDDILITVQMANRPYGEVYYQVGWEKSNYTLQDCFSVFDNLNSSTELINPERWEVSTSECFTRLTTRLTIPEYLTYAKPEVSSLASSDIIHMDSILHMTYVDATDDNCIISNYHTEIAIRSFLKVNSVVEFAAEDIEVVLPPVIDAIYLNGDGFLVIEVIIQPASPIFYFTDFEFVEHSTGLVFVVQNVIECPNDESTTVACPYRVILVSTTAVLDYTGVIEMEFIFHWPNGRADRASVDFDINYELIEDPDPIGDGSISGVIYVVNDNDWSQQLDVFSAFFRTYIVATTDPIVEDSNADLSLQNVYLCCTKDRNTLPAYNPDEGNLGCTARDDDTMSFWGQLVADGAVNTALQVRYEDGGQFTKTRIVLSFNPSLLYGEDKLCYLNAESRIVTDSESASLVAQTAVSFKSCSFFTNEAECLSQVVCRWDSSLGVCWNLGESAASGVKVSFILGFVAMVVALVFGQM